MRTNEVADLLDAAGFDRVVMETVGVGQSELDIAAATDTTVVVLVPESGDGIQAMKAGLMEIADCFVMNKADRPGADQAVQSIKMILGFKPQREGRRWKPEIVTAVANEGKGVDAVASLIEQHKTFLESTGGLEQKRAARLRHRIRELIDAQLQVDFWNAERTAELEREMENVLRHRVTPYDLAERLLAQFKSQLNDTVVRERRQSAASKQ